MDHYELIVGNIGTVWSGNDQTEAQQLFNDYAQMSSDGYGRAAGEPVTLLKNGVILLDFLPTQTEETC